MHTMARPVSMLWAVDTWPVVLFYLSIVLHSCGTSAKLICRGNEKPCPGKAAACVPVLGICNGIKDCPDGSDEDLAMCKAYNCTNRDYLHYDSTLSDSPHFKTSKCPSGNMCTKKHVFEVDEWKHASFNFFVCTGGTKECVDGSDEDPRYCKNLNCTKFAFGSVAATCPSKNYCLYPECYGCGHGKEKLCDGNKDCPDGSDEWSIFCKKHGCSKNADSTFRCNDGGCVKTSQICNGVKDCVDGSDENSTFCAKYGCPWSNGRKCPGGRTCLRQLDTCDGKKNCPDGSDEAVDKCRKYRCPKGTWKCKDGVQCAYAKDKYGGSQPIDPRCNNHYECKDKSDESIEVCAKIRCPEDPTRCPGNKACLGTNKLCNGKSDCIDGSDETAALCANHTCFDDFVKCKSNNKCVRGGRCDGRVDCEDGSDEDDVSCKKCPAGFWRCPIFPQCISSSGICNGPTSCFDGGDENVAFCKNYTCPENHVKCGLTCQFGYYCDGLGDCPDSSDDAPSFCRHYKCPKGYSKCGDGKQCALATDLCRFDDIHLHVCNDWSDTNPTFCNTYDCGASQGTDYFKCTFNSTKCFANTQRCDGIVDCPVDKQDEANCLTYKCVKGYTKCPDKLQCILTQYYCDGTPDCKGGADEEKNFCKSYKCPIVNGMQYVKCPDQVTCKLYVQDC